MPSPILNLLVVRSPDMARTGKFYSALGIEFIQHRHSSGPEHLAATLGGLVFEIYPGDAAQAVEARIGFGVPDIEQAVAALLGQGGTLVSPPKEGPWGKRAVLTDPDGRKVELVETP